MKCLALVPLFISFAVAAPSGVGIGEKIFRPRIAEIILPSDGDIAPRYFRPRLAGPPEESSEEDSSYEGRLLPTNVYRPRIANLDSIKASIAELIKEIPIPRKLLVEPVLPRIANIQPLRKRKLWLPRIQPGAAPIVEAIKNLLSGVIPGDIFKPRIAGDTSSIEGKLLRPRIGVSAPEASLY